MMAVLAVVGAILMGCAGEDMANEAPQAKSGNKVIQTTTISLGGSAGTRAFDADGKKTFAVGDQIAIYYKNTSDELQLANSAALTANDISRQDGDGQGGDDRSEAGESAALYLSRSDGENGY